MEEKKDLGRIIKIAEENTKWGPIIFFLAFFVLFILVFTVFAFRSNAIAWMFCLFMLIWAFAFLVYMVSYCCEYKSLCNHLKKGTVLIERVSIDSFEYYSFDEDSWYYVICYNWWEKYKENLKWAQSYLHWWCKVDLIDRDYCKKKWVPYSPNDPKYDEEAMNKKKKNMYSKIELMEKQLKDAKWKDKDEIKEEIRKLNDEMKKIVPPYVYYKNRRLYIWDEITVYINPNNHNNYIMDI